MMKRIPTGIENFKTLIDKNAYYIDKTNFISEVLNEKFSFTHALDVLARH